MWLMGFAESKPAAPDGAPGTGSSKPRKRHGEDDPMTRLVPWLVSFLLHAGLVAVTLFVVWTTVIHSQSAVVPDVSIGNAQQQSLSMSDSSLSSKTKTKTRTPSVHPTKETINKKVDLSSQVIGLTADSATASPFSASVSSATSATVGFGGSRGNAHRIAFVVDASGSLIDSLPFVIEELEKSIRNLHPPQITSHGDLTQYYAVIFFRGANVFPGRDVLEAPPMGMTPASVHNKQITINWLSKGNVEAGGQTNPIPALKRAMAYNPQLIFLLSDNITGSGQYELDQAKLISEVEQVVGKRAKINTIQFLYPDPLDNLPGRTGTMKLIAEKTGGTYTFYSPKKFDIK